MRDDHLGELERALSQALMKVRELAAQGALPPVLEPLNLIAPPRGFVVNVELRPYEDHAREASWNEDDRWDARNGEVLLSYEPARDGPPRDGRGWHEEGPRATAAPVSPPDPEGAVADVIRVVLRAESDPSFKFLALKFLRDQLLPRQVGWASVPHEAQIQINRAIDEGVLVTSKVENPRQPQYPVTAVQLNRDHPKVQGLLAAEARRAPNGGSNP